MKNIVFFLFAVLLFASCEETIELDLKQTDEVIIIEGLITDQHAFHTIKITTTIPFNTPGKTPRVSGAVVTVSDAEGATMRFLEKELGKYVSEEAFAGKAGETYSMRVEIGDKVFTASETLRPALGFTKVEYRIDEDEKVDPEDEGRFYEVLFYANEPQETEDYYLFKLYRNGIYENGNGDYANVVNDVGLSGTIEGYPVGIYFAQNDTARLEVYNISRRAYRYYLDLNNNVGSDGGMFEGIPANVGTNIEGGALGYFQVSGLTVREIVVE